ncbi:hypothetical protein [Martelella limonii]|uniref:hypothetical protein n=1 Tax=Martelella limonii TaxID=1647649 RepID=UPI0019D64B2A|nr:hypothetical protein [Martelella limonii]
MGKSLKKDAQGPQWMQFRRTIGIDYSGAETADSSLKGLRVFMSEDGAEAAEVLPPSGAAKHWSRRRMTSWLIDRLNEPLPTIVGIDHAFSFPDAYFRRHDLAPDWDAFLDDFSLHWPLDEPNLYVDFVRFGSFGNGAMRSGERRWRRLCEQASRAKSVFHFDVPGQVAKSTHSGLPFLRQIRQACPELHIWPFDGWEVPSGRSCLVEAYPRLYASQYDRADRTEDQHDAFAIASWLRDADQQGTLVNSLQPDLSDRARTMAKHEGWIIGVEEAMPDRKVHPRRQTAKPAPERMHQQHPERQQQHRHAKTTRPGYRNRNGQIVIADTGLPGTDHNQRIYQLCCGRCGHNYGANGSDIHLRRCPACDGGKPGLRYGD